MMGTIHPISFQGLLGLLLAYLPESALQAAGDLFQRAASDEDGRIEALFHLGQLLDVEWDTYPDELIVSLSPMATTRQLQSDISQAIDEFREQRDIVSRRNREENYGDYLQVWDLREGWSNGEYHVGEEQTLAAIAAQLSESVSTISNRYRRAFELITGHEYSPELWFRVFGPQKLLDERAILISRVALRRPRRSPSRREVPETQLITDGQCRLTLGVVAPDDTPVDVTDLRIDLQEFLNQGLSDAEIADRFGLSPEFHDVIRTVREQFGDRPQ